ncbi:MAG: serine/threonine protein kinase [Deltaproteobacteria bacterium]|nr:serine/threonine protein kinase [Deltaproteobacteria bacterium]
MDRTGEVLDNKYKLLRLLGEGGMGAVYEAQHTVIGRRCAVKFLHAEIAHNAEVVKRFIREAQAAAAIGHPNIIDIYDVGVTADGAPYLVMEYLLGSSLADELEHRTKLPPAEAAEIVAQALSALEVAHSHGVVHRDLKPDNLYLVRSPNAPPRVKILDFGISKIADPGKPEDRMTSTGMVLGTPYYMAPEQARGDRDIDHRIDLYAMGIVLYESTTGRVPFTGDNYNQLLLKILTEKFPAPRQLEPSLSEAFEAVILKAIERERDNRYRSAREMHDDLLNLLDEVARARLGVTGEQSLPPLTARPSRSPETVTTAGRTLRVTGAARKRRWALPAAVAGALAALAVGLVLWAPWNSSPDTSAAPAAGVAEPAAATADAAGPAQTPPVQAAAVVASLDAGTPAPSAADASAVLAAAPEAAAAPADAAPAIPPPDALSVGISLQGLPENAEVFWDGAKVDAVPFRVARGDVAHRLEIRADGFEPYSKMVTPDQDVSLVPDLRHTGHTVGPRPARDGGTTAGTTPTDPTTPRSRDAGLQQGGRGTSISTGFE